MPWRQTTALWATLARSRLTGIVAMQPCPVIAVVRKFFIVQKSIQQCSIAMHLTVSSFIPNNLEHF